LNKEKSLIYEQKLYGHWFPKRKDRISNTINTVKKGKVVPELN
jgi:hypothetical protein